MSLDDEQAAPTLARLEWIKLTLSLAFFTFLSLVDLTIFLPGFENVHLHFLYAHIFITILLLRHNLPMWGYLFSIALFDLLNGFASFNMPIIAIFYIAIKYLQGKNLGWGALNSWLVFALLVLLFESLRSAFSLFLIEGGITLTLFFKIVSLHILIYPLVLIAHKGFKPAR
jgi:hypothetical protein